MVFESVIVDILNKYLKPYVKRLDSSQLNLGVWKGDVRVEKLELKEDLFAEAGLDVPLRILRSYVGKLEAHIPWKSLTKEPIEITIDEVYVILGPDLDTSYDPKRDLARRRKEKKKKIKDYHDALKKKKNKLKEAKKGKKKRKDSEKPDTFAEKLAVHMTKNLQVKVRDIHLRYEDHVTNPSTVLAAGITLHSLNLKSTDSNWVPCVVRETATLIYKLIEMNCLGLYWNTSGVSSFASPDLTTEQMIEAMRNAIARPAVPPPPTNSYLLNPMSAAAKLKLNLKPGVDLSLPQLLMGMECEDIVFSLQQSQMKTLLLTVESYDRHMVNQKFLKYKPLKGVIEDTRAWWRYAISAVLEEDVKRKTRMWSWTHIKEHRERVKLYVEKYHEKTRSINPSSSLLTKIQELEDQLDWFNILVYREEATKKEKSKARKDSYQVPHKVLSKTLSTPVGLHPLTTHGQRSPSMPIILPIYEETETGVATPPPINGASPNGSTAPNTPPIPDELRRVVESSRKSKKAKDKDGGEKRGSIFSRWRQKHKAPEKRESVIAEVEEAALDAGAVVVVGEHVEKGITETRGSKKSKAEENVSAEDEEDEKDRQELYQAIGYSPDEEYIEYPKDYVAHEIHVMFSTLKLELYGQKQKIGTLVTERINVDVLNRPSSESVSVRASVGTLEMEGVPNGNNRTTMITSKLVSKDTDATLVNLALEIKPLDRPEMDITVNAVLKPLQITYDFATVDGLIEMFKPPNHLHFQELTNAASASWEQLKVQTTAGLQDALQNRKQLDLDIRLHSPYLIMPEGGTYSKQSHLVVVDLGELRVFGTTKDPKQLPKKLSDTAGDFSEYYDKFTVKLAGMQVLVAEPGEDWRGAMASGSSPLHIIAPTGFEIQLLKSIITDDALLATMRVEGTIPGLEINLSDTQVATLVKTLASQKMPPSLVNKGVEYNELPSKPVSRPVLDNAAQLVEMDTVSLMSVSSFGDEEYEEEAECSITPSLTSINSLQLSSEDQDMSRNVFKDVSIKLIVNKVAVKLSQTTQKGKKGVSSQSPLLDILISDIQADVVDRKWDTQGSITMKEVAILDHITTDGTCSPTYLLKTKCLHDGNFVSARFVTVTLAGTDFAAKYTGLQNSVSAQLSLVKLTLHRSTIKTIIEYFNTLEPVLNSLSSSDEPNSSLGLETIDESSETLPTPVTGVVNLNDFEKPITKEFHFDVQFEGVDIVLVQDDSEFLDAGLTGFSLNGSAQPETVTVVASIKDLTVKDASIASNVTTIISKTDKERSFVLLNVVQYNLAANKRIPHDLDWVDTSLKAEVNRVNVSFNATFMSNVLEFVKQLEINKSSYTSAAKATAETASVTANAIIESTKTAHRLKLDLTLHAPVLELPFTTETRQGSIFIDLGEFRISNHLKHGHEARRGSISSDATMETLTLLGAQTVLDCMQIQTTSVQIFRRSHSAMTECTIGDRERCDYEESQSVLLEPVQLTANITRNVGLPNRAFPNVDISLSLEAIKLHLHEEDIHALIKLGVAASRISEVVATPPKPVEDIPTRPRFTTTFSRPKRDTLSVIGRQRSRTRANSKLKRFHTYEDVTEVRVDAKLASVTFDLTTNDGPLLQAGITGLCTKVDVLKSKVLVSGSATGLSVVDLSTPPGAYSQVVSIVDKSGIVSSLQLTIYIQENAHPLSPLGKLQANVSQIQLYIPVPFVISTVMFVQRLGIDKAMLETASKTAQDGATAVTTAAQDKFLMVDVKVQAPVLIVPTSQEATQGLMVDLGSFSIQNTLLAPADNVGVDAYGFTLSSFKISRVLLDPSMVVGCPVLAERTLLQPFDLLLAVERNLCPWYTKIPTININLNMNDLKIYLGSDDIKEFFSFGMSLGDQVSGLLPDPQPVTEVDSVSSGDLPAQSESTESADISRADSETEAFEFLRVLSSLTGFEIKLFRDEPKLSSSDVVSQSFSELEDYALALLQLVTMEASVNMSSNNEVNLKASMKDIALCDMQNGKQDKITGNRVIQHYTSNPLKAYTGQIEHPVVSLQYFLRNEQHIIIFKAQKLLILSDVEFMKTMADYFTAAFDPNKNKKDSTKDSTKDPENTDLEKTLTEDTKPKLVKQDTVLTKKKKKAAPLPKMKINASIKDLRVALIENVDTPQPQALTLKLSTDVNMQLTETSKFVDLSVADLGIATSSFFDLDNTTSWVLLPCSMSLLLTGPVDKPAMNIQATVDPISLTLSPAIVRLIIHAVQTLIPKQEEIVTPTPTDLWEKKVVSESSLWFFSPVKLHKAITDAADTEVKEEVLTVTIESVEVYLESESVENSPGYPVLALTVSAVLQLFEWTGELSLAGDLQCEASYYNQMVSVWEPLIEPLETDNEGKQRLWDLSVKMDKKSSSGLEVSVAGDAPEEKPQFSLELASVLPLQVTLTKTSLQLIKTLVESCSREYGKQVQGSVNVDSLTGAPFTLVNKLGEDVVLFVQPGPTLKFRERAEFSKLNCGESVDVHFKKNVRKRSYASLVTQRKRETPAVDISVGNKFRPIKNIALDNPGEFYYTLIPKTEFSSLTTYGLVIEVAVTGEKKTITARSSVQFNNQLLIAVDVLLVNPDNGESSSKVLKVLKPNDTFSVPLHRAANSEYYVRPSGFGFQSQGPPLSWKKSKHGDKVNLKCVLSSSDPYYIRVNRTEECYKIKRQLPQDDFAHHIFHLHPPLVVHNLLPFDLYLDYPSHCIEPGKSDHMHYINLDKEQEMSAMVNRKKGSSLQGKFVLKRQSNYINFYVSDKDTCVELTVHIEDESYLKLGVFCPFWMVNKTDLILIYKEGDKASTNHPVGNEIVLLSTSNKKNKIQLCAVTANSSQTEPSKYFSLNAIGSSGNFSSKLGDQNYKFGVEIRLSQFTLTKLVIVTPYYLLVNETKVSLQVYEESTPANKTTIPPEEVIPFWPLTSNNKLVAVVANSEKGEACSAPFNYQCSDFTVIEYTRNSEVSALCLEVQESESATVVTFSPYYPGCVPVQIINHFTDITLQFKQDTKSPLAIVHTLQPREMMYFTWDDPSGKKAIRWNFPGVAKVTNCKPIDVNKDSQQSYNFKFLGQASTSSITSGIFRKGSKQSLSSVTTPPPVKGVGDAWIDIDENLSENLVSPQDDEEDTGSIDSSSVFSSFSSSSSASLQGGRGANRGYWKSFIDGLQRVIIFTPDEGVLERIRAENSYSVPLFEASLSFRSIGLSLVDNDKRRELAYIAITQSGFIWQIDKGKGRWKTVNTSLIEILEQAYQAKEMDIKQKNLTVNMETMEMYSPIKGKLRRTNHDGLFVKFSLSEKDYSVHAKIGYVQMDNQLPFSVYPQVLYPLPPPPTVASTTEPKPFIEASIILRKNDQSNGYHFKYVHVLIQKMAVNVDLGFILSLVEFFALNGSDPLFQAEYVEGDIEYVGKSLKETVVPELAEDFNISRSFFDVLHLAPIKVSLSFNIRSVGQNKAENEITTGDRFLELFLHSIGVILTSVQETEMKFSVFHLEYQPQTGRGLTNLLLKHYRNQLLFQLHTLIFGLDVLGNPVSVVRGVVDGAIDLFYEPIKGSVLGPEEFFEGLGLGLRSFFGAGVVGGITGASARITGAVGDVFAKLTFDNEFINKRQQQKAKPPKIGSKLGGFAKNLFEGITGVVTQPVKGLQKEGAVGLLKGTGRGLVGLITRPTGGLVDLASGTLNFVTRKTQIGNFEITDIRPPRFIGRNAVVTPFSPHKAIGTALLVGLDEGNYVETDFYFGHVEISKSPPKFVLVTDRRFTVIERRILTEGWKSSQHAIFEFMSKPVEYKDVNIVVSFDPKYKEKRLNSLTLSSAELASEIAHTVNDSYLSFVSEQ